MKMLLLVPILLLASCMATSQAVTRANELGQAALALAAEAKAMAEDPDVTQGELDAVVAAAIAAAKEAATAAAEVPQALKDDVASLKEGAGGVLGGGGLVDLLAAAAAAIFGANAARNNNLPGTKRKTSA